MNKPKLTDAQRLSITVNSLAMAFERHGTDISPCPVFGSSGFRNCITTYNGEYVFWYNTPDENTHVIRTLIPV